MEHKIGSKLTAFVYGITLLALFLATTAAAGASWKDCGPSSSPVTVSSVQLIPDPPVSGSDFTIELPAETSTELAGGSVNIYVTYYGIPVHIETQDLCAKTKCPIAPGPFTFSNEQFLPSVTPSGTYYVKLTATGTDKRVLFCTRISFQIVRPSSMLQNMRDWWTGESAKSDAMRAFLEEAKKVWPKHGNGEPKNVFEMMDGSVDVQPFVDSDGQENEEVMFS